MTASTYFDQFIQFLRTARNFVVSSEDRQRVLLAIEKRLEMLDLEGLDNYMDYLEAHPAEFEQLFFQINHTLDCDSSYIFNEQTDSFLTSFLGRARQMEKGSMRMWVVGCGGDVLKIYRLAIAVSEFLGYTFTQQYCKIFATDKNENDLAVARHGSFTEAELKPLSDEIIAKYFDTSNEKLTFSPELRRSIIFGKHDILSDPAISRMDLIVCRDALPFLNQEQQRRVSLSLIFALNPSGFLVLGNNERLPSNSEMQPDPTYPYIYRKIPTEPANRQGTANGTTIFTPDLATKVIEAAFEVSPVAQVSIDVNGVVACANAKARLLFGLLPQDMGKPIQDLELSYRPIELRSAIDQSKNELKEIIVSRVSKPAANGRSPMYDVIVRPLFGMGNAHMGTTVLFKEVTDLHQLQNEFHSTNQQLFAANQELQSAHEELETTNEEVNSTNEELETTNEELQSTNEELETMNEELRSTNTELEFSNRDQRELTAAVDKTNEFLQSILSSMRSAVVVLDEFDRILIWNKYCNEMWGLREDEVLEQNFFTLDIGLPVESLEKPVKSFEKSKETAREMFVQAVNRRGQEVKCKVRMTHLSGRVVGKILVIDEVPLEK